MLESGLKCNFVNLGVLADIRTDECSTIVNTAHFHVEIFHVNGPSNILILTENEVTLQSESAL